MRVRALSLDVDDTLIDTTAAMRAAVPYALSALDPGLDTALVLEAARLWAQDEGGHYAAYEAGAIDFVEQRRRRFLEMAGHVGVDPSAAAFERWEPAYEERLRRVRAFPEVTGFLDALDGLPVVLVTNYEVERQRAKLAGAGLVGRFLHVVGSDTAGLPKPHAAPFLLGCELVGADPAEVLHVGDHVTNDVRGALDAGLQAVWLERSGTRTVPAGVERVRSLTDLLPRLRDGAAATTTGHGEGPRDASRGPSRT